MANPWTETEKAYLAGIIDGEGSISLCHKVKVRTHRYGTVLFIGNTDERLIAWVHNTFGGKIGVRPRAKAHQKDLWWVNFTGSALVPVLVATLPYLVLKREQALLMLEFRGTIKKPGTNVATSTTVIEHRADMKARMALLNRRGA